MFACRSPLFLNLFSTNIYNNNEYVMMSLECIGSVVWWLGREHLGPQSTGFHRQQSLISEYQKVDWSLR